MARRTVMNESAKWRSGRDALRTVFSRFSGRGGETPRLFGDDEGVAGERDRDMVLPAEEAATFEVVEAEFSLHVFVDPFGTPALLDDAYDALLAAPRWRQIDEIELGRFGLAVLPLHEQ